MMASEEDRTRVVKKRTTPYEDGDINFAALADFDPDFAAIWDEENNHIDFQDPQANKQISKTLLEHDFGLTVNFPDDRLCPPVPIRWNYVHWIQQLIETTAPSFKNTYDSDRAVVGLDIGTGASAIIPLLACASRPAWTFYATDIDEDSTGYAYRTIGLNDLEDRIDLLLTSKEDPLIPLDNCVASHLDFVTFNPPFFLDDADMRAGNISKSVPASAVCTGTANEMIAPGGDLGFALRMLEESKTLKTRIQWYTLFMGKHSSVLQLADAIKEAGCTNWAVATFQPGKKTQRWGVGWSWGDLRPSDKVCRDAKLPGTVQPAHTEQTVKYRGLEQEGVEESVCKAIEGLVGLGAKWEWNAVSSTGIFRVSGNIWGRDARRKRKREQAGGKLKDGARPEEGENVVQSKEQGVEEAEPIRLAVKITFEEEALNVRWVQGLDNILFESFCGWIKRQLSTPG